MKRFLLLLIAGLSLACSGNPEPAGETTMAPTEPVRSAPAPTEQAVPDGEVGTPAPLVGGASQMAKIVAEDWKRVNEFTRLFYSGDLETLHGSFSDSAKSELPLETLSAMRAGILANHGEELEVVAATKEENQGYRAYKRAARFSADERLIEVAWVLGPDDSIAGLYITPQRTPPE